MGIVTSNALSAIKDRHVVAVLKTLIDEVNRKTRGGSVTRTTLSLSSDAVGLTQDASHVGNTAATLTDLHSYTIPAGLLGDDGDSIEFDYAGTFDGAGPASRIVLMFGSTMIYDSGAYAPAVPTYWRLRGRIVRASVNLQRIVVDLFPGPTTPPAIIAYTAGTEALTSALDLTLQGEGTNASDVTKEFAVVNFRAAA